MNEFRLLKYIHIVFALSISHISAEENNMFFYGTLTNEPCTLAPEDQTVDVDFESIVNKDLYLNARTAGRPFTLHLQNCSVQDKPKVSVTFTGNESSLFPGLLLPAGGVERGVMIGIESDNGKLVMINKSWPIGELVEGENNLSFKAYLVATPEAKVSRSIALGPLTASVTFEFSYD